MYRLFLLLIVLLGSAAGLRYGAAWYVPALVAAAGALLLPVWRRGAFYYSLLATVMVWGIYAGYLHVASDGALGDRLATTFGVATGWVLVVITALWGGLTAGLGGWAGASLRFAMQYLRRERRKAG